MSYRSFTYRTCLLAGLALNAVAVPVTPAVAQANMPPEKRAALMALARDYVERIGSGFGYADRYLDEGDRAAPQQQATVMIPDGEILLLKIKLDNLTLQDSILAIKQGPGAMVSLRDFTTIARFAINVNAEAGTANGWFIREEQPFVLDLAAGTVTAGDAQYTLHEDNLLVEGGDIYIRDTVLAEWFDYESELELSTQTLMVKPQEKWPVQRQMERRNIALARGRAPPSLPRQAAPYELAAVPNVDVSLSQSFSRSGDNGDTAHRSNFTIAGSGDLAGHTARAVLRGDREEKLTSARLTLSREAVEPVLLGPLQARYYEFGDIASTNVPMTGTSRTGLGFRATNASRNRMTGPVTDIIGEAQPGWDVELYRNNQLIANGMVGDDGRYVFEDVVLFSGDNEFRIVQYGPLGEIREDTQTILSNTNLAAGQRGVYDMSVAFADTEIWTPEPRDTEDKGQPQLSATYEMQLAPDMTAATGVRSVSEHGQRKNYVYGGVAKSINRTVLNAEAAYDIDGALQANLTARTELGRHSFLAAAAYRGAGFGDAGTQDSPANYDFRGIVAGPLFGGGESRARYNFDTNYRFDDDGAERLESQLSFDARVAQLGVTQSFNYVDDVPAHAVPGGGREELSGSTQVRGTALGTYWRAGVNYNFSPDPAVENYILGLTRKFGRDIRGNVRITHQPEVHYTEARGSLSWNAGKMIVSPSVTYDSERNLAATLNLNMGFSRDPYSGDVVMAGRNLREAGGFSALVFLDRDGDNHYDPEVDELLPDVNVRAVHAYRSAFTNEKGEAFIYDLPSGRLTDVIIDEGSFMDPFWIPAYEGVSVLPRPGYVAYTVFPVHEAGEIDGTVYVRSGTGTLQRARNIGLNLFNYDGRIVQAVRTAPDGFYLFNKVPPGRYLLMADQGDAALFGFKRPAPQEIEIGYDGTIIYGNDITLEAGRGDVPVGFAQDISDYLAANPAIDPAALADKRIIMNLGAYRSQILMGVTWYKLRHRYDMLFAGAMPVVRPSESFAAPETGRHELLVHMPGLTLPEALGRCRVLAAREIPCAIELMPRQAEAGPLQTAAR